NPDPPVSAAALAWSGRDDPRRHSSLEVGGCMASAVVTGGSGFLGSHLCDYLLGEGHRVICVDNLDTGSLQNIEHIKNGSDFLFVNHDLTQPWFIEEPVDFVFHLAS